MIAQAAGSRIMSDYDFELSLPKKLCTRLKRPFQSVQSGICPENRDCCLVFRGDLLCGVDDDRFDRDHLRLEHKPGCFFEGH